MDAKKRLEAITNFFYCTEDNMPEPEPFHPTPWRQISLKYQATLPPESEPDLTKTMYHSKAVCYLAIANAFRSAYELHRKAFTLDSDETLITKVTDYYTDAIHRYFFKLSAIIAEHCRAVGNMDSCRLIARLVIGAREHLLQEYQNEILNHPNLYTLPPLSQYVKKSVLYKKNATRIPQSKGILSHLYTLPGYRILSVTPGWKALHADTENLYQYFIDKAHQIYIVYLCDIITVVNTLGVPAPAESRDDDMWDYITKLRKLREAMLVLDPKKNEEENKEESV